MASRAPIFLCGTSRSGTSVVQSALEKLPGCSITGETHYFDDLRARSPEPATRILDEEEFAQAERYFRALTHRPFGYHGDPEQGWMGPGEIEAQLGDRPRTLDNVFRAYNEAYARLRGGTWWGEKTPRHVFRIAEILRHYPEAKVIIMRRDPRAVVASYRDWRSMGGLPQGRISEEAERNERTRARASYHPVTLALLWKAAQVAAESAIQEFGPEKVRVMKFEDVVFDANRHLGDLVSWLGFEPPADLTDVPTQNSSYDNYSKAGGFRVETVERWKSLLSAGEARVVEQAVGSWLARCGYEPTRGGGSVGALRHWATFPRAVVQAARSNADRSGGGLGQYVLRRARLALGRA